MNKINSDNTACWMVRENNHWIRGPYTKAEVLELIKKNNGKVLEFSKANSYWFSTNEKNELYNFFPELKEAYTLTSIPNAMTMDYTATLTSAELDQNKNKILGEWLSEEDAVEFGYSLETEEPTANPLDIVERARTEQSHESQKIVIPSKVLKQISTLNIGKEVPTTIYSEKNHLALILLLFALVLGGAAAYTYIEYKREVTRTRELHSSTAMLELSAQQKIRIGTLLDKVKLVQQGIQELKQKDTDNKQLIFAEALLQANFQLNEQAAINILKNNNQTPDSEWKNLLAIYSVNTNPEKSLSYLEQITKQNPNDKIYYYNLGLTQYLLGNKNATQNIFNQINTAKSNLVLGAISSQTEFYQKAISMDHTLMKAKLLLATTTLEKNLDQGIKLCQDFIDEIPYFLGQNNIKNYRELPLPTFYEEAKKQLRKVLSIQQNADAKPNPTLIAMDAFLSILLGQNEEAEKNIEQALIFSPGHTDSLKVLAFLRYKQGRLNELKDLLIEYAAKNPNDFAFPALLGNFYLDSHQNKEAKEIFNNLSKQFSDKSIVWAWLGLSAIQTDNEFALEAFKTALRKNPTDFRALNGLFGLGETKILLSDTYKDNLPIF